ncbi:hypothetical protein HRE53_05990 [Acaryochloris sp. 'Moss Beach']|uniref:hypothetical protein n=1 Tax=Acaryochloris sp. 'Moss Beach' TaxID=2740837 RepID=UPI001F46537F|nr:hypothetical protein [Acaryochloris sp. 'Moss Beach']UJB70626.1 hypothetical protein HRE53_05990 [Acaryochloris sp. 'Moss Beach']
MKSKDFGLIKRRRAQLEACKNNLSETKQLIDWGIFRSCLEKLPQPERQSKVDRKPTAVFI